MQTTAQGLTAHWAAGPQPFVLAYGVPGPEGGRAGSLSQAAVGWGPPATLPEVGEEVQNRTGKTCAAHMTGS